MSDQLTKESDNDTQCELAAWELLKEAREERDKAQALARELRDALAISLNQWRANAEMNGAYRDFDNENTLESQWFQALQKVLTKAKEVQP
jgi:predicted alpha/beta superfamily hydrolase